jgi:adenylate cyclase
MADPSHWLLTEGRRRPDAAAMFGALCRELVAGGLPLQRAWYGGLMLHPMLYASGCTWIRGAAEVVQTRRPHGFETTPMWLASPAYAILSGAPTVRRRLEGQDPLDFPVLADVKAAGGTDYYMYAAEFNGSPRVATSFTADRPGGFSDADIGTLDAMRPAWSAVLQIHVQNELASTLLQTYLGADAGKRVLDGQIRRGDGQTLPAAVWFSDLRDFTGLSDRLPRDRLLDLLNDGFEAQVGAIEAHGGEVLKFMGDGLLAIFPANDDPDRACRAAVDAALDADARIEARNTVRVAAGDVPIRYGLALHIGDVMYGNIGSSGRLDFTVIGPAVNRAARLEAVSAKLGRKLVLSRELAARCGRELVALGSHALKGVAEPELVYGLA